MKMIGLLSFGLLSCLSLFLLYSPLRASELTFKFTNPSFGGDAMYGGFLLQQAQLQNKFKEKKASPFKPKTLLERFAESFTNQLLYRMAAMILDQIFGEDDTLPEREVTYSIGNFRLHFIPGQDTYTFELTDITTGQTTILEIPRYM